MYFQRRYKTGTGNADPRQKEYAVYFCDACNKTTYIDVSYNGDFDYVRPRVCPLCKSMGKEDRAQSIQREVALLTQKKTELEVRIEQLIREAETLKENAQ
jgi:hypothetical protein